MDSYNQIVERGVAAGGREVGGGEKGGMLGNLPNVEPGWKVSLKISFSSQPGN